MIRRWVGCLGMVLWLGMGIVAQGQVKIEVDASQVQGEIRALHGVNGGPLNEGETVDLRAEWKELAIPIARLHDCEWPRADIVDVHAIFPNFDADAKDVRNYQFAKTDEYLQGVADTGAKIVYRLGESIEHTRKKHHVHPPKDNQQWTEICLGIIRHVNEGWGGGVPREVEYWEIWNEPENRPVMWTGSDEEFFQLYVTAAKGIKAKYPKLKVGGPAIGAVGELVEGKLKPYPLLAGLVANCKAEGAPLDFLSWHTYTNRPSEYRQKAETIRAWLDKQGFSKTEIHLNEWNYLPGNDWSALLAAGQGLAREKWYDEMGGSAGASFLTSVLMDLQESPVTVANFYSGDSSPFGLFTRHGVRKKSFYGMLAFRRMLYTPLRLAVTVDSPKAESVKVLAGKSAERKELRVMVSQFQGKKQEVILDVKHLGESEAWQLTAERISEEESLERIEIQKVSPGVWKWEQGENSVVLLKLSKE